jgi:EAL and modified HD-GYP domain-containing signal transduction protein
MLINRQPVFDGKTNVQGYQSQIQGKLTAGDRSRRDVLHAVAENLDELAGNHWALISLPAEGIDGGAHEVLSRERTLVWAQGRASDKLFQRCLSKLTGQGYRLAVSAPEDGSPASEFAQIVHLRLGDCDRASLAGRIERLRRGDTRVMLGGVQNYEDYEVCKAAGADLFEGRFFCQPKPGRHELPLTRIPTVRLLTALQNPDVRLQDLEELVRYNLPLSYKLLNFTNSTYVGLSRPVESVKHAVGLVGIERIRKWASMLLFSTIEDKPRELFTVAAVRARMCEQLADSDDEWRQSVFFTVGLLSVLDAVLDRPIAEVVGTLPLCAEVRDALIQGSGILGATLHAVRDYEAGDFESEHLRPFHPSLVRNAYFDALHWTRTVSNGLMI